MQVFRLMAMPDRIIAFDNLPQRLLQGFEMCRADGFPRHWKEWMGKTEKITKIPPEKDQLTGSLRRFDPIVEEDCFFYLVDWTIKPVTEKWKEVTDFVRQHITKDFRLMERIEDMAKPLADNKTDGVTLEPEDVVVIPIPIEVQEKGTGLITPSGAELKKEPVKDVPRGNDSFDCSQCEKKFDKAAGLRLHTIKKHKKEAVAA